MLLVEAVDVPVPTLVVADDPGAVTEGEADALPLEVDAVSLAVVVAADCADTSGSMKHSAEMRKVKISMLRKRGRDAWVVWAEV